MSRQGRTVATMTCEEHQAAYLEHRVRYLPTAIRNAERKLSELHAEADLYRLRNLEGMRRIPVRGLRAPVTLVPAQEVMPSNLVQHAAWTPARTALARTMWLEGATAGQIARELRGVTRDAVLGKVRRLGLTRNRGPQA